MDPRFPDSFVHKTQKLATGRTYHFVDQLPADYDPVSTTTLLCIHGFPDIWYGWRYQIGPWVRKGYRVVVPDMLGYGETDKPLDPKEYIYSKLSDDLAALLDAIGVHKAVIIGHDWGAFIVSRFALHKPERLQALIMLSIPFSPPMRQYVSLEQVVERLPDYGYQLYFAEQQANTEIYSALELFIPLLYNIDLTFTKPGQLRQLMLGQQATDLDAVKRSSLLTAEEQAYYLEQFALTKDMNGPLNYYRLWQLRFEEDKGLPDTVRADLPVLTLHGSADPVCSPAYREREKKLIPQLKSILFEGVGHWVQVETKERVVESVDAFLRHIKDDAAPHL